MRPLRIIAIWIAVMSGGLSIVKDFWFAYLASIGQTIPATGPFVVLGHLSLAAFVISGLTAWWLENRRVKELRTKLSKPDVYVGRHAIVNLHKRGKKLLTKIERRKRWPPSQSKIDKLRTEFTDALELCMSPRERSEILRHRLDEFERAKHLFDFTEKQMKHWDDLWSLLRGMDMAIERIDRLVRVG